MRSQWAYSWVMRLSHAKRAALFFLTCISMINLVGLLWVKLPEMTLGLVSLVLISLVGMKLLDSVKSGILLLGFSLYVVLMTLGLLGWVGVEPDNASVLAWVVVMTMMMSHLIHFMAALLRAMARGSFQHDAIAETLTQTHQPILLSSVTTVIGFAVAAFFNAEYSNMALIVGVGVLFSYLVVLIWLPWVLLNWLLEFRVGQYEDRHGLVHISSFLDSNPLVRRLLALATLVLIVWALVQLFTQFEAMEAVLTMVLASFVLLLLVWQNFRVALVATLIGCLSVIVIMSPMHWLHAISGFSALVLVVPMGIVLDDVVHFFSRYLKAEQSFFSKREDKIRFALASVGRSIWLTSQLLIVGLLVLLFSDNDWVRQASLMTILSILLVSFLLLTVMPAIASSKADLGQKNKS
ncbi:RND transporter family protein [Hydrogenovibrio kuenenii]|uniref:hypothetical protein n=1 Tax=Hydrogenovibrio kuenenii TaxID=63658 RepID=UPI0004655832|nr:hypothetical protein [Hydrogenovibrio kuenenii]